MLYICKKDEYLIFKILSWLEILEGVNALNEDGNILVVDDELLVYESLRLFLEGKHNLISREQWRRRLEIG